MKLLKTIAIFLINKLLELWYLVIKDIAIGVVFVLGCTALVLIAFDLIGFVAIALIDTVGLHALAYSLFISGWKLDTPFIIRGFLVGASVFGVFCIGCLIVDGIKKVNIKKFIKSNWEMAKQGKFYSHG